ncbi:unnamed protein product [Adineta ricciae]|uniref:Uncharacterized protein n=1 Tax=Adineta ricciae TaxID=249248 RepID=A0A815UFA4_ADIRI|nr:unnamed protein product [Adineta ricciae]CAF1516587.1 unnamed protein product [Adineta ricciae]CAF1518256.1 unnamed protein product [Adineta ricciae]
MIEATSFRDLISKSSLNSIGKRAAFCQAGCTACLWEGGSTGGLNGYVTCDGRGWVYRDCGAGTNCKKAANCQVYCG